MIGGTRDDGNLLLPQFILDPDLMEQVNKDFDAKGAVLLLGVDEDDVTEEDSATAQLIRTEYLDGFHSNFTMDNFKKIGKMFTDVNFLVSIDEEARLFADKMDHPVYYYNYR